jgi:hypothetical protein
MAYTKKQKEMISEAIKERDKLVKDNPKLQEIQDRMDKKFKAAKRV